MGWQRHAAIGTHARGPCRQGRRAPSRRPCRRADRPYYHLADLFEQLAVGPVEEPQPQLLPRHPRDRVAASQRPPRAGATEGERGDSRRAPWPAGPFPPCQRGRHAGPAGRVGRLGPRASVGLGIQVEVLCAPSNRKQ